MANYGANEAKLTKRALFMQEVRSLPETEMIMAPVTTVLVATAKNILSPFTSLSEAKSYQTDCRVPVATTTIGLDELVVDRNVGNAVTDCDVEMSYATFDLVAEYRADLLASVLLELNKNQVADVVADSTNVATATDLSTAAAVRNFLIGIKANNNVSAASVKQKVDGATVKKAKYHGVPFVAAGPNAYVAITDGFIQTTSQNSMQGLDGEFYMTPLGVLVINLGDAADDPDRLVYGVGGVPVIGYRTDKIDVGMGTMVDRSTAASADLDIAANDPILEETWYMKAHIKAKGGVFSNNVAHVKHGLMA